MSDIVNPHSGRIFRQVDNTLAEILVDFGLAMYHRPMHDVGAVNTPTLPKVPTFTVGANSYGKAVIILTTPTGNVTQFAGEPSDARNAFKVLAWSGAEGKKIPQGPEPPKHIIEEYATRYDHAKAANSATARRLSEAADHNYGAR